MKPFHNIHAVSFDVGGTLVEPWPSVGHVYAAVATEAGLPKYDPAALNRSFTKAWRAKKEFDYSRESWAQIVASTFEGDAREFGVLTDFFARLYERFAQAAVWQVYSDVRPTLQALRAKGLKLAVVSNWDDRLRLLLHNLQLDGFFDAIEVSVESGFHKPAPQIFRRVLERLGLPAETVLHVGDSRREDLEGARGAGLKAVLLRREQPTAGVEQISSLEQLLPLIAGG